MTPKNLIWLTLDSIRGDRTSVGGHDRATTPNMAQVGDRVDGVAGTCFSHAIWSQPSVASIMTGTYLSTHGSGDTNTTLPESIPTVAERLADIGYHTVGVSSNPYFSPTTGIDRGFEEFDFVSGLDLARAAGPRGLLSFLANLRTYSGGWTLKKQKHDPNYLLNELVKNRLRTCVDRDGPFFLAAHYSGAHHPYYPSPKFRRTVADGLPQPPDQAAQRAFELGKNVYAHLANDAVDGSETRQTLRAMYDAQVRQVDALVGELVEYVDHLGLDGDTVVVITSDHGDMLGELGLVSHKLVLHDALIRVPLAVRGSDRLAGVDLGLAQHADIMTTLLDELGADTDGMQGIRLDEAERTRAVAQRGARTHQKTMDAIRKHTERFDHDHVLPGFLTAVRTDEWKYVSDDEDARLYSLPAEDQDVASAHPEVVDQLDAWLAEWLDRHGKTVRSERKASFDEDVQQLLADLGYVEGG